MKKGLTYFVTDANFGAKLNFARRMCSACQKCEKSGCINCKAYFFDLFQPEECESDLHCQNSNDYLWRMYTETNECKSYLEKV